MDKRLNAAWRRHERIWKNNLYVYPVVSRRSRGLSIGLNLNPGKECNFDCIYCQVDRTIPPKIREVDLQKLESELDLLLDSERSGSIYKDSPFDLLAPSEHGVRDIAFSGDGEPTAFPRFGDAVRIAARARNKFELHTTKLILLTDAAYLNKPAVKAALEILDANNGEIWAKLDAGTEEFFRMVNRPNVTLARVLENILDTARLRPVTIQSLWFRVEGALPPPREIEAFCARLNEMVSAGARFNLLQLYTVARRPAESSVFPLSNMELDSVAASVRTRVLVPVEVFY